LGLFIKWHHRFTWLGTSRTARAPSSLAAIADVLFLLDFERMRPLALSHGIYIQLPRCKMWVKKCISSVC
jgi:hypothetical protein